MVFLNVYDSEKPIYAFMANYMGNKIPVRIPSLFEDVWGTITKRCLLNDLFVVDFDITAAFCTVKHSPLPYPDVRDVNFWIEVNLMRLEAETCEADG